MGVLKDAPIGDVELGLVKFDQMRIESEMGRVNKLRVDVDEAELVEELVREEEEEEELVDELVEEDALEDVFVDELVREDEEEEEESVLVAVGAEAPSAEAADELEDELASCFFVRRFFAFTFLRCWRSFGRTGLRFGKIRCSRLSLLKIIVSFRSFLSSDVSNESASGFSAKQVADFVRIIRGVGCVW